MTPEKLRQLVAEATSGPWKAEDGKTYLAGKGWWVAGPEKLSHDGDLGEADARLIALAPVLAERCAEMGEALERIVRLPLGGFYANPVEGAVVIARPALAKLSEMEAA